jgi:hypothetical protein
MVSYMFQARVPLEFIVASVRCAESAMQFDAALACEKARRSITAIEYSLYKELREAEIAFGREITEANYARLKCCQNKIAEDRSRRGNALREQGEPS